MAWQWFHRLGSPRWFYEKTTVWVYVLGALALLLLAIGIVWGIAFAPAHYNQGNSYRIIYLHVPAAILALVGYYIMAIAAAVGFIWRIKLSFVVMRSAAIIGAVLTFLALFTGSLWGKPTWGTWWEWDGRIVTMLILLLLYLGVIALQGAFANRQLANKACAILAIVGTVNIPIIYKSVDWWFTLHQPATLKPKLEFTGIDTITYSISDGKGGIASAQVFIQVGTEKEPEKPLNTESTSSLETIKGNNRAPVARADGPFFTPKETLLSNINVLANDTDPDGDLLTVSAPSQSRAAGVVVVNDDGSLTYTPWRSHIHKSMLAPLLLMIGAFYVMYTWLLLLWTRAGILSQERRTQWVRELLGNSREAK